MGAGQSKPGDGTPDDPGNGHTLSPPHTRTTLSQTTSNSLTSTSDSSTTLSTTLTSTTTTDSSTTTTTTTTTITTTSSTPTPPPVISTPSLTTSSTPFPSGTLGAAQTSTPSKGVPIAAIVLPCLLVPFIIAGIALYVIRRQRMEARRKLLDEFDRRSMFGTRGNELFQTAKHETDAPRPGSLYSGYTPSSYANGPSGYPAQPTTYAAPSSTYAAPSATYTALAPSSYASPLHQQASYAWQQPSVGSPSASTAWAALGVPQPVSPLGSSPDSSQDMNARRTLRVTNARSIASISTVAYEEPPRLPPPPPPPPPHPKTPVELSDDTLKAWMQD